MVTRRITLAGLWATLLVAVATSASTLGAAAEPPAHRNVIVFGGSGQLGSEIVRALLGAGHRVTVFARPSSNMERIAGLPVMIEQGDATKEDDVARVLSARHYDVVIDALGRSGADVVFFAKTGPVIARQAKANGVRQLILHSSVGVGKSAIAYPTDRLATMRRLFEAKKAGEDAAIESGLDYTIIRNAVLRDPPASAPEQARLVADESVWGTVSRRGLARLTLECIEAPQCKNRIFHTIDDSLPVIR